MAFTNDMDTTFMNTPSDDDSRTEGASVIRAHKDTFVERLQKDHEIGEELIGTGVDDQPDTGAHKWVNMKQYPVLTPDTARYTRLGAEASGLYFFPQGDAKYPVSSAVDWNAKDLLINIATVTTITATAKRLKLISPLNQVAYYDDFSTTFNISNDLFSGTTEKASHWYALYASIDKTNGTITRKMVPCLEGTADADTANSLDHSTATFITDKVRPGDIVYNMTDYTKGYVGAVSSETVLTIVDSSGAALDLFPDGNEDYKIIPLLKRPTISSTTTSTTADKLVDSGAGFVVAGVAVGDIVTNTTDGTYTLVTAVDSATTLSLADDIMTSGENYTITASTLLGLSAYAGFIGFGFNNSGSNLDDSGYTRPESQKKQTYTSPNDFTVTSATSTWTTTRAVISVWQEFCFGMTPAWYIFLLVNGDQTSSIASQPMTVTGIVFKNISNYFSNGYLTLDRNGIQPERYNVSPGSNTITIRVSGAASAGDDWGFGGTHEMDSKPAFATRS